MHLKAYGVKPIAVDQGALSCDGCVFDCSPSCHEHACTPSDFPEDDPLHAAKCIIWAYVE